MAADWTYGAYDIQGQHQHVPVTMFRLLGPIAKNSRVLDIGCGSGYFASLFAQKGCLVVGIDTSEPGIEAARRNVPGHRFEVLHADENVLAKLAELPFDIVVSTEVIEHLYDPDAFLKGCFAATKPGGKFVCSTPYHGYLKNVLIAVTGKFDFHMAVHWPGGHIKFFSRQTLTNAFKRAGFVDYQFAGTGRLPWVWKSMILMGTRPA